MVITMIRQRLVLALIIVDMLCTKVMKVEAKMVSLCAPMGNMKGYDGGAGDFQLGPLTLC